MHVDYSGIVSCLGVQFYIEARESRLENNCHMEIFRFTQNGVCENKETVWGENKETISEIKPLLVEQNASFQS